MNDDKMTGATVATDDPTRGVIVEPTPKKKRGFAAMSREQVSEIARKGGKAAHAAGTAHEFKAGSDEAREAGKKGGRAVHRKKAQENGQ